MSDQRSVVIDGVRYVPEKTQAEYSHGKVRYIRCMAPVTEQQRALALSSNLHRHGDMLLVWVNEGDLFEGWLNDDLPSPPNT